MREEGYYFVKYESGKWEIAYFDGSLLYFNELDYRSSTERIVESGDKIELPKD